MKNKGENYTYKISFSTIPVASLAISSIVTVVIITWKLGRIQDFLGGGRKIGWSDKLALGASLINANLG